MERGTDIDTELFEEIRELFRANWKRGAKVRLLGVHVSSWAEGGAQMNLMGEEKHEKWSRAMAAADRMRDRFGDSAVSLAASLGGEFRERTHETVVAPGQKDARLQAVDSTAEKHRRQEAAGGATEESR